MPLGGKWKLLVGNVEECDVESRHLQGCSPCLCRLRIDGLALGEQVLKVPITCRWFGLGKSSSRLSTKAWLFPTTSMVGLGEKLGMDSRITQPGWGLCWEPFFLEAVDLLKSVDDLAKGCYMWTTWDTYGRGSYVDRVWKACDVLVGFSPVGCTSIRIAVTLGYE
jgi:hypothetical protein